MGWRGVTIMAQFLKYACIDALSYGPAEFMAFCQYAIRHRPFAYDGILYLFKAIAPAQPLYMGKRASAVVPGAYCDAIGFLQRPSVVFQFLVGSVEEVFHRTCHIAEVFRRTENDGIAFPYILCGRVKGPFEVCPGALRLCHAGGYGAGHSFRVACL